MSQLWQNTPFYRIGRLYVDACIRSSFNSIKVFGRENVPSGSAVIFAANHTNTLMDPLVILQNNKGPICFGCRSDIFTGRLAARILHELKIVPLARQRDGVQALKDNFGVFDQVTDLLAHKVPFTIFPEGTHRPMHSLMPMKKGVCRIAFQACEDCDLPVYIVPVGIDYEDFFRFQRSVTIKYGEPIDVRNVLAEYDNEQTAMHALTDLLYSRIAGLITYFPDDAGYEKAWRRHLKKLRPKRDWVQKFFRGFAAVVAVPLLVIFSILGFLFWVPAEILISRLKDKAWSNTIRFAVILACLPLQLAINGIAAFSLLPPAGGAAVLLLTAVAGPMFYRTLNYLNDIIK